MAHAFLGRMRPHTPFWYCASALLAPQAPWVRGKGTYTLWHRASQGSNPGSASVQSVILGQSFRYLAELQSLSCLSKMGPWGWGLGGAPVTHSFCYSAPGTMSPALSIALCAPEMPLGGDSCWPHNSHLKCRPGRHSSRDGPGLSLPGRSVSGSLLTPGRTTLWARHPSPGSWAQ